MHSAHLGIVPSGFLHRVNSCEDRKSSAHLLDFHTHKRGQSRALARRPEATMAKTIVKILIAAGIAMGFKKAKHWLREPGGLCDKLVRFISVHRLIQ